MLKLYRSKSSFNSEKLAEFIDSSEAVQSKNEIFRAMENDPLFHRSELTQTLDEMRKITQLRAMRIIDYGFIHDLRRKTNPFYAQALVIALVQYDICVLFKATISTNFFGACVKGLGSAEQQKYFTDACDEKLSGCFALTEVGHGSDARHMRTTASYDPQTRQFVLHSENFQAAKCWVGNLGQGATHATVLAQLIMPDGQNQGLHAFVTPIRDPNTFQAYPGVIVGDMGEKIGFNGVDNGFCMFDQYRIPRENLLSKFGEVTEDGEYHSPIKDPQKRFVLSLGTLIAGRTSTLYSCVGLLSNAITIAVRYSAVRKQFGPTKDQELSIIEYPLQQLRLFRYLAALFAMKATTRVISARHFDLLQTLNDLTQMLSQTLEEVIVQFRAKIQKAPPPSFKPDFRKVELAAMAGISLKDLLPRLELRYCGSRCDITLWIMPQEGMDVLTELHGILSAGKVVFTWTTQTAIQQCREACGGHGYLKCAGFGGLRNDNDAKCTYEGDNNVLQQQAGNWLVRLWRERGNQPFPSPFGSVTFLYQSHPHKMAARSEQELCHPPVLLEAYQWLMCWLAEKTTETYQSQVKQGHDTFTARNHSQVYRGQSLSMAYGEHYMSKCFWELCCQANRHSVEAQAVLTQLCALYVLTSLEKHLVYLHQGEYIDSAQSQLIQSTVLKLCGQLKDEAVSLVDVVAPTDFVLNSVLGHSNGEVFKNLERALMTSPGNLERPVWWTELSGKLRSRL